MSKLTATFIRKTKQTGWHSDALNKLWLFVGKDSSTKSWKFKGRVSGREIKKTIGHYPAMSLAEARELANVINSSYKSDIDYFAEQDKAQLQSNKNAVTFQLIAREWLEIKKAKGMRPNTLNTDQKRLDKHILPVLADTPIKAIDKAMLRDICDRSSKDTPNTANRLAGMFQSIFEHAVMTDAIDNSPAQYLTKIYPKPKTKNNPYLEIDEIPELLTALRMGLQFELIDGVTYRMILIQLHTLSRPSEVAMLKWEYIDFNSNYWHIPVMEGVKLKEVHTQPLSPQVISMLEAQRPYSEGREYVFPSVKRNGTTPHRNTETANKAITLRLKFKDKLTAHGLRHTGATALGKLGYDRDIVDMALSHQVGNEVSRTYNKDKALEQRREMLNFWSKYLSELS